jgi:hypothetical protein
VLRQIENLIMVRNNKNYYYFCIHRWMMVLAIVGFETCHATRHLLSTSYPSTSHHMRAMANNSFSNDTYFIDQSTNLLAEDATTASDYNETCNEFEDENCYIDHNVTCVGDKQYCNLTYDEYMELLLEYIYPTTPEWILIASHTVVFVVGLVSNLFIFCESIIEPFLRLND